MITTATITLDDKVKKAGQQKAKENKIRGGFSAYIEELIVKDLKKN